MDSSFGRCVARLARHLGPWADERTRPAVRRRAIRIASPPSADGSDDAALHAWVYSPQDRAPAGSLLLIPGLHFLGPADPRLDRFAAILADAGLLVLAPFLPDFRRLRVAPRLVAHAERAFDALRDMPGKPPGRPGVFSISFGSLPALALASRRGAEISSMVVFGGYADWNDMLRFSLGIDRSQVNDPLNRPVVFLNLLDVLPGVDQGHILERAWLTYVRQTWGRPEMKRGTRHHSVARELAGTLPEALREPFLRGTGVAPGGVEWAEAALARAAATFDYLDPRPHLARLTAPITFVHGRSDDVVPHTHVQRLRAGVPRHVPARAYVTGMYAHSGGTGLARALRSGPAAAREVGTMVSILRAIADAGLRT